MKIIDMHCDTVMKLYGGQTLRNADGHIDLDGLRRGDCLAQCFAIFYPGPTAAGYPLPTDMRSCFDGMYAAFRREMEAERDVISQALCVADILKNDAEGRLSAVLTIENADLPGASLDAVDEFYEKGVRMMSLTWNSESCLGYPCSPDPALHARGLKPLGIETVRRMNELGIAVDVSHLSEGGFWDVVRHSTKPVIASHSCARALCDHCRDLTDEQLRAIGESGGVVGVNFYTPFLLQGSGEGPDGYTDAELVARHLRYIIDKAGLEAAAFGSDYDGIPSTLEWEDYGGSQRLIERLEAWFTPRELELISHGNVLRAFGDTIG